MDALEGTREMQRATVTVDRDGIITKWDDAVTEIAGYSADEALGRSLDVVIPPRAAKSALAWIRQGDGAGPVEQTGEDVQSAHVAQRPTNSRRTRNI
jgi:PAS domain S-box-containing protein